MSQRDIEINDVLPWGRSLSEYRAMFGLTDGDLERNLLSCADGPASFNAEMFASGRSVISVDPVYRFSAERIWSRIEQTRDLLIENTRANSDAYIWDHIPDIETLTTLRMTAMNRFLDDFEEGKERGRYVVGALPELEFEEQQFDLVLCSHCLFTYTEQLDEAFHIAAVREMVRVGREVRIFPLLDLNGEFSRHVGPVEAALHKDGRTTERIKVDYEFQKGGNEYLRITG